MRRRLYIAILLFAYVVLPIAAKTQGDPLRQPLIPGSGYINPHVYAFGMVEMSFTIQPKPGKTWTVVNFQPVMTPLLYHETYLFCGDQLSKLQSLDGQLVVLIYSRAFPETAKIETPPKEITACHSLDFVRVVPKEEVAK